MPTEEAKTTKAFSESIKNTLFGEEKDPCRIEDCHGIGQSRFSGLCEFHHLEKIKQQEAESEKRREAQRKEARKLEKNPKASEQRRLDENAMRFFMANPWCHRCGRFCEDQTQGWPRLRKIQPKEPTFKCRRWETICRWCAEEGH